MPPRHLRRTVGAIIWRRENGAKWRALPAEHGPWWMAAHTFIRWARLGVSERLLRLAQERGVALGMAFLDGTSIRSHQNAAGRRKSAGAKGSRGAHEALGRSRGGFGTKACVVADGSGRAGAVAGLAQALADLSLLPPKIAYELRGSVGHQSVDLASFPRRY